MKIRILCTGLAIVASAVFSFGQVLIQPQKANEQWVGVWEGQLESQPGVTITLVDQDGRLGGTAVFNVLNRAPQPHVIAKEPHMLLTVSNDGGTLHFQIRAFQNKRDLQFDMKMTGDGKAQLKCLNCEESPETEIVRAPVHPASE